MLLTGALLAWFTGLRPEGPSRLWEMGQGEQTGGVRGRCVWGQRGDSVASPFTL